MKPLGIISGTVFLQGEGGLKNLRKKEVATPFGRATVFCSAEVALIARHGTDPDNHILPHLINHPANLAAMKKLGVREVLGVKSTGSLKKKLKPGMLAVPDDYLMPFPGPTAVREKAVHIAPVLSQEVRRRCLEAAQECGIKVVDGGIYWQTAGPRLETKAEIAMMAKFADLVGMTMASEAIVAQELEIAYASVCSVDNYAHGIGQKALTMEEITRRARQSAEAILKIVARYLKRG